MPPTSQGVILVRCSGSWARMRKSIYLALVVVLACSSETTFSTTALNVRERDMPSTQQEEDRTLNGLTRTAMRGAAPAMEHRLLEDAGLESESIRPIDLPFLQRPRAVMPVGTGISLVVKGEPKSGTTWTGRLVAALALHLCGSSTNQWCRMGGLKIRRNYPAPSYEFEMINSDKRAVFLHFKGKYKHDIPGLQVGHDCNRRGWSHRDNFEDLMPCKSSALVTRKQLRSCLPDTSPRCIQYLPSLDPSIHRMIIVVRDPRNVVISEHRMKREIYKERTALLDAYIHARLKTIVAWMHLRWVWHTTTLSSVSHTVFYEDLQDSHHHLVGLAAFMGLDCTPSQALEVWEAHRQRPEFSSRRGDYTTYGLPATTLTWMNATMASLLPEPMLDRWGVTPTGL